MMSRSSLSKHGRDLEQFAERVLWENWAEIFAYAQK